jgi:hypothetical protein
VEVDGPSHDDQQTRDQRRTDWLAGEGIIVLRFAADDVELRPALVLAAIARAAPPLPPCRAPSPVNGRRNVQSALPATSVLLPLTGEGAGRRKGGATNSIP